jgi:hypothetical protein
MIDDINDIGFCLAVYEKEACGDCPAASSGDCIGMRNMVEKETHHLKLKARKLKARWTLEVEKDLELMKMSPTRFPFSSI